MAHLVQFANNLIFEVLRRPQKFYFLHPKEDLNLKFVFEVSLEFDLGTAQKKYFGTTKGIRPFSKNAPVFPISNTASFYQFLPFDTGLWCFSQEAL